MADRTSMTRQPLTWLTSGLGLASIVSMAHARLRQRQPQPSVKVERDRVDERCNQESRGPDLEQGRRELIFARRNRGKRDIGGRTGKFRPLLSEQAPALGIDGDCSSERE